MEELEDERRWARTFAESQDLFTKLAEEACVDIKAGRVKKKKKQKQWHNFTFSGIISHCPLETGLVRQIV